MLVVVPGTSVEAGSPSGGHSSRPGDRRSRLSQDGSLGVDGQESDLRNVLKVEH